MLESSLLLINTLKNVSHWLDIKVYKVCILSLATGLSFINIFAILSIILIPIIDTTKNTANIDQRIVMCKLKKIFLKNYIIINQLLIKI